ncbi:MAG: alpha/beta hydrolase [Candidatus Rokuibacteriota bacterium]
MTRRLLIASAATAVMGVLGLWWLGAHLVKPDPHAVPLPADFPARALTIPGTRIAAWWLDRGAETPAILLLHAKGGDRSSMLSRARLLLRRGFSVALIDLPAHGETPGPAITFGRRESADVRSALAWLRREAPGRRVGVIGCSLGGAAVLLGPQPVGVDAVVLEMVYPRFGRAIENRIRIRLGALAPLLTPLVLVQLGLRLDASPMELEPIRSIGRLGAPVLVVGGSRDQHTTLAESEEMFHAAAEPKRLWIVDGARHQDLFAYDPAGYDAQVVGFLVKHLRPSDPVSS